MQLFTDGASRNNPGEAGGGIFLKDGDNEWTKAIYLGKKTNNEAEYLALIEGLKLAKDKGAKELELFMDSQLIIKQLRGEYKVKKNHLIPLFNEARTLLFAFSKWTATHVLRAQNKEADRLANLAIDSHDSA